MTLQTAFVGMLARRVQHIDRYFKVILVFSLRA